MGFEDGGAMALGYLATAPSGTFQIAAFYASILPEEATLLSSVNSRTPFGGMPALFFRGALDEMIPADEVAQAAAKFTSPAIVTSSSAGHHLPLSSDSTYNTVLNFYTSNLPGSPPIAPPPSLSPSSLVSCLCSSDPTQYSTLNDATRCFGANDITNLEVMFAGQPQSASTNAFYTACSDYDNDGVFRANDLTNMKRYYAGMLAIASHHGRRRL
mmetsp:Transcript_482/g.1477  ORF Transcript_482/g.1477 Transcript_482/m.1477 type:complete len:214 (+) Transcript_482:1-642(+)